MKEEQLIFIISQPRSGSTFLQGLLSNNDLVNTCSEPWILLNFNLKPDLIDAKYDHYLARSAFNDYLAKNPGLEFKKEQKEFLLNLYSPLSAGYSFVVDKTPRYWEIMERIQFLFPASKIILLKRNPLLVAKSMITTWHLKTTKDLHYFHRDLLMAPKHIHAFSRKNIDNKNIYTLKYEDLVAHTAKEVEKIYTWLGIPFTKEVCNIKNNQKYKGRYGDPFLNSNEGREEFKKKNAKSLTHKDIKFLKGYSHHLGMEFLGRYGYDQKEFKPKKTYRFMHFKHLSLAQNGKFSFRNQLKYMSKEIILRLLS